MSETKHTPGSWGAQTDHDGTIYIVASAWPMGQTICSIEPSYDGDRPNNARLIAAAPDMLAALQLVKGSLKFDREDEVSREVMRRIDAAVADATRSS